MSYDYCTECDAIQLVAPDGQHLCGLSLLDAYALGLRGINSSKPAKPEPGDGAWERLYAEVGNYLDEYKTEILNWLASEMAQTTWKCKAQRTAATPQDCGWPVCGCDPYADRVIEALQESGALDAAKRQGEAREYAHKAIEKVLGMRKLDLERANDPAKQAEREYYLGRAHRCDDILFWLRYEESLLPAGAARGDETGLRLTDHQRGMAILALTYYKKACSTNGTAFSDDLDSVIGALSQAAPATSEETK